MSDKKLVNKERMLTAEELIDIERFQKQRRKSPVPQDAWLYVAEIDRLLTHIRLDREQLENEIFQDITDPTKSLPSPQDSEAGDRESVREGRNLSGESGRVVPLETSELVTGLYTNRMTALEGRLELEKVRDICDVGHEFIVGLAFRDNGASNVANVERDLFMLNGKEVRVVIEWRNPSAQATVSPQADNSTTLPEHRQASLTESSASSESKTDHSQLQRVWDEAIAVVKGVSETDPECNTMRSDVIRALQAAKAKSLTTKLRDEREED